MIIQKDLLPPLKGENKTAQDCKAILGTKYTSQIFPEGDK